MQNNIKNIDEMIQMKAEFENYVFESTSESIKVAETMIDNFNKSWVQNLILYAGQRRLFKYKLLGDLFEKTLPFEVKNWEKTRFSEYLFARGLIKEEDVETMLEEGELNIHPLDEYEKPIKEGSIQESIFNDDVSSFVSLITMQNKVNAMSSFVFEVNGSKFTPLQFACLCGSLNIIKYLLLNNVEKAANFYIYAIYSGSEEVIEFLLSQGYKLNFCLFASIQFHQNHIAKWLFESHIKDSYSIANCITYFNTEMLLFLVEQISNNSMKQDAKKILNNWNHMLYFHITKNTSDTISAKYLNSIHNSLVSMNQV